MTITVKHIISFDNDTKDILNRLIKALNLDAELNKAADQLKQNTDSLEKAIQDNTPGTNS